MFLFKGMNAARCGPTAVVLMKLCSVERHGVNLSVERSI